MVQNNHGAFRGRKVDEEKAWLGWLGSDDDVGCEYRSKLIGSDRIGNHEAER